MEIVSYSSATTILERSVGLLKIMQCVRQCQANIKLTLPKKVTC